MPATLIDYDAIKARQQTAWASGNYSIIGTTLQIVGESLCEALDVRAGSRVLDVAAGNGNATLAAARRWCDVTSTDFVSGLLETARRRAAADSLTIAFREADAENLPFDDGAFDVVLSTFGVMFTPRQEQAASELARVCRPGGKIGLANWTPEGFVGQLFKVIGKHVPPAPGLKPPGRWGTAAGLRELFGPDAHIQATPRDFMFRYKSPAHFVDIFRTYYGPTNKAFAALDGNPAAQAAFAGDLIDLLERGNRATDGTLVLPGEYLEVVITKG
ncbi:MAG: class I SAM-dependent methyltransferase [Gemmatimonadaceae bacterium]